VSIGSHFRVANVVAKLESLAANVAFCHDVQIPLHIETQMARGRSVISANNDDAYVTTTQRILQLMTAQGVLAGMVSSA
jgi:hypothetical protein